MRNISGYFYTLGEGGEKNDSLAFENFKKAAELKNCKRTAVGMIKNIKGEKINDSVYTGITLN